MIDMEKKSVIIAFVVLSLLAIGGSSAGIYYYAQYKRLSMRSADPTIEVKDILAKVGKLIELPEGEEPTVATVQDAEKIKAQPFFAKAQNGQRVILFSNAKLAILLMKSEQAYQCGNHQSQYAVCRTTRIFSAP